MTVQATNEIDGLSKKAAELAADLDRNWLLQVLTAGLALLYVVDQSKAGDLATNFKISPDLIEIAVPLIYLYLFVRMGYLLGVYLETRRKLVSFFSGEDEAREVQVMTHRNVSVFAILSVIVNEGEVPEPGGVPLVSWLTPLARIPYIVLVLSFIGVSAVNSGLGLYFSYDLTASTLHEFAYLVPVAIAAVLTSFYLQFANAPAQIVNWPFGIFMVAALVASLAIGAYLIEWHPIASNR